MTAPSAEPDLELAGKVVDAFNACHVTHYWYTAHEVRAMLVALSRAGLAIVPAARRSPRAREQDQATLATERAAREKDVQTMQDLLDICSDDLDDARRERDTALAKAFDADQHAAGVVKMNRSLQIELGKTQTALASARTALVRIGEWTHQHGAALVPSGADSYGEGMRNAKRQVAGLLTSHPSPAPVAEANPVPMDLKCPACDLQHVDAVDAVTGIDWSTRLHKTHLCLGCGHLWKPAPYATVGIQPAPVAATCLHCGDAHATDLACHGPKRLPKPVARKGDGA